MILIGSCGILIGSCGIKVSIVPLKEGGLTDAAKLIWVISHVYDAGMTLYTLRNRFMVF